MKRKVLFLVIVLLFSLLAFAACDTEIENGNIDVDPEILAKLPATVEVTGLEGITGKARIDYVDDTAKDVALRSIKNAYYLDDGAVTYAVDIKIVDESGAEIEVGKPITVGVELKTHDLPLDQYVVFHVHNGKADQIVPTVDGNKLTFTVDSFSPFIIGPKHLHQSGAVITDTPATCKVPGVGHTECIKCHQKLTDETINALGHVDEDHDGLCDRCGESTHEHVYGAWQTYSEQSCVNPKVEIRYRACGAVETRDIGEPLGHIDGNHDEICDRCGESLHTHVYGEWQTKDEASCVNPKTEIRLCKCGAKEVRTVGEALGHVDKNKDGLCDRCGEDMNKVPETPEHVHAYGEWITVDSATCTEKGSKKRSCECGAEQTGDIAALGHIDANGDGICDRCSQKLGEGLYTRDGDYIYFGTYPQTRVTDESLISKLTSIAGAKPTAADPQKWTAYSYNLIKCETVADYMWYIDVKSDGVMYRGVYFVKYRPVFPSQAGTAGDINVQSQNGLSTFAIYWYRYDPIKWRILSEENGEALLLSELILDSRETYASNAYGTNIVHNGGTGAATNYDLSDIRIWLNDFFYETAFSEPERELIQLTHVVNNARSTNPAYNATEFNDGNNRCAGHSDNDYVFLLSLQELTDSAFGFAATLNGDSARKKGHTDYAVSQGLNITPGDPEAEQEGNYRAGNNWATRSPREDSLGIFIIDREGYVGNGDNDDTSLGVVPALRIRLLGKKPEEVLEGDAYIRTEEGGNPNDRGDYIYFGSYPQSRVTDATIIGQLNDAAGEVPGIYNQYSQKYADNWYNWDSYDYYYNGRQDNFMFYIDIELNGEKYRGVYIAEYRPYFITSNNPQPASYQNGAAGYTKKVTYWFRYDPIQWRILSESDGKALVFAQLVLDSQDFYYFSSDYSCTRNDGSEGYVSEYALSDIRKWLNETFYETAFNALEKSVIGLTNIDNSGISTNPKGNALLWNNGNNAYSGDNCVDRVFLLSENDITNTAYGFNGAYDATDEARQKDASDYARSQGARVQYNKTYAWWLRSADYDSAKNVRTVSYSGSTASTSEVYWTAYGVVPAMVVYLNGKAPAEASEPAEHAHNMAHHAAKDADCLAAGNEEYYYCAECGKYFTDAEGNSETTPEAVFKPALGHIISAHSPKAATCTTDGNIKYFSCSRCNNYYSDEAGKNQISPESVTISATGHNISAVAAKSASCLSAGNIAHYTCTKCKKVFSDAKGENETTVDAVTLPALGHIDANADDVCDRCGESMSEESLYTKDGDFIYFGYYPQTKVTDEAVISAVGKQLGMLPTAENNYNWTSYGYYMSGSADAAYMWYMDVEYEAERYRAVYYTACRPQNTLVGSTAGTTLVDDNGYSLDGGLVYYFKFEPIKWKILVEAEGKALLFSDMIIDAQDVYPAFTAESFEHNGDEGYSNNYALSSVRKWLNEKFFNTAFNKQQQALVIPIMVDNSAESTTDSLDALPKAQTYATDVTVDRVYLLSEREVTGTDYGFDAAYGAQDKARQKKTTDYARIQGAYTYAAGDFAGNGIWWLRSPGSTATGNPGMRDVGADGNTSAVHDVNLTANGIVPALLIELE